MKHTLKSLLITSVLTMPSIFGSEGIVAVVTHDPQEENSSVSIVSRCDSVTDLTEIGSPRAAAEIILESFDHPDTLWFHVRFIAAALEKLGYLDSAIQASEYSMQHPNTQMPNQIAKTKIETIKRSTSSRAPSYLNGLSVDCFKVIAGSKTSEHSTFLGFLPLGNLNKLALTSRKLNKFIQPLLTTANTWRHSDVVPRLLLNSAHPQDDVMLQLFGIATPSATASFYSASPQDALMLQLFGSTTASFYRMILCVATDLRFSRPDATQMLIIDPALRRDTRLRNPDSLVKTLNGY